jgi:hypothetical protein
VGEVTLELSKERAEFLLKALLAWYADTGEISLEDEEMFDELVEEVTDAINEADELEEFSEEFIEAMAELVEE